MSILQPAKPATPDAAALGLAVHVSTAPEVPVPPVMAKVTLALLVVTVLPSASWIATFGCVIQATPPVPPLGCWVKLSCAAAPGVTTTDVVPVFVTSLVSFTVMLWLGDVLNLTPFVNVCVPLSPATNV